MTGLALVLAPAACRPAPRPLRLEGTDLQGRKVAWAPRAGQLGVVVAAPAKGCPGCFASVLRSVTLLVERRRADVDAALVIVDGMSKGLSDQCPEGAALLHISRRALERAVAVPGLPLLLVVSRGGRLARVEWLPPMQVDEAALAEQLERYFTLEE